MTTDNPPVRILHLEDSRVDHALVKFALQRNKLPTELVLVDTIRTPLLKIALVSYVSMLVLCSFMPLFYGLKQ